MLTFTTTDALTQFHPCSLLAATALILAAEGNAQNADKLVSDIYGEEGCVTLGLPGNLTASNFGKLGEMSEAKCSERDLARSLLQMVTQQSVLLASAHAKMAGCIDRVFFAGGFVDEKNWIARKAIAANFRNLQGCAYFLRHSDFLGALGSLRGALRALEGCRSPTAA
ncbi:Pantothenate kinase 4 [Symbiodinium microadriaticum]|uniref:Pantothenate kinase 4 n=1 Tax=Symbiodinium microadriaticum TaxID=2951 RepID=A0A1Q9EGJ3_SYMMI|nr:Pantothenate kinase 4 [Symbiodinium microadriaticum]